MTVWFVLQMRNTPTWNGRWSGEGKLYAKKMKLPKKKATELLEKGSFWYSWSDRWSCEVIVVNPGRSESSRMTKNTSGFCGYDWMIPSIIDRGEITPPK